MVTIGFNQQCITPKLPVALRGYAGARIAREVHDNLYTRVLAMDQDGIRYLFIQCDLIGVDDSVLNAVFKKISDLNIKKRTFNDCGNPYPCRSGRHCRYI